MQYLCDNACAPIGGHARVIGPPRLWLPYVDTVARGMSHTPRFRAQSDIWSRTDCLRLPRGGSYGCCDTTSFLLPHMWRTPCIKVSRCERHVYDLVMSVIP